jgi:hypothetical protein
MTIPDERTVRRDKPGIKQELAVIPGWALAIAFTIFLVAPVLIFTYEAPAPLLFRILISVLPPTIFAFLVLMIGYVNRDAGRRGMSRTLWTIIVICVPNAIGFILYFLLRNPIQAECPKCRAVVDPRMNYCPNCRYSFHPMCSQCKRPVRPEDTFCTTCGAELERHG